MENNYEVTEYGEGICYSSEGRCLIFGDPNSDPYYDSMGSSPDTSVHYSESDLNELIK